MKLFNYNEDRADDWFEYESRKKEIVNTSESPEEYDRRITELCEELGI